MTSEANAWGKYATPLGGDPDVAEVRDIRARARTRRAMTFSVERRRELVEETPVDEET